MTALSPLKPSQVDFFYEGSSSFLSDVLRGASKMRKCAEKEVRKEMYSGDFPASESAVLSAPANYPSGLTWATKQMRKCAPGAPLLHSSP